MASGSPFTINLSGTKDGVNKSFTLSVTPDTNEYLHIMHNGKELKPSWHLNAGETITDLLRYNLSGGVNIEVGIAPAAGDDLWAQGIEA
jgi:hypothetical protein